MSLYLMTSKLGFTISQGLTLNRGWFIDWINSIKNAAAEWLTFGKIHFIDF